MFDGVSHFGNAGACVSDPAAAPLLKCLRDTLLQQVGHSGEKERAEMGHVNRSTGLRYHSTQPMIEDSLVELLEHFSVSEDRVDSIRAYSTAFWLAQTASCHGFANTPPEMPVDKYSVLSVSSFLVTTEGCWKSVGNDPWGEHQSQVPHVDFSEPQLLWLQKVGALPYVGCMAVSEEGCYLRAISQVNNSPDQPVDPGHMLHIPNGCVFWQPATLMHGGGFRTGPMGNPRMHFLLVLVLNDQMDTVVEYFASDDGVPTNEYATAGGDYSFEATQDGQFHSPAAALIVSEIGV